MRRLIVTNILILFACVQASTDVGWARRPHPTKKIIIAVIDTGISTELLSGNSYCKSGHKDFTGTGLGDNHGHGTHISGIIDQYAKNIIATKAESFNSLDKVHENYCQIIVKFYDPNATNNDNVSTTIKAFRWAIDNKVDIINYSGGGATYSAEERSVVREALNKGIKIVAAAGNEKSDIDKYKYYPAMHDKRIYIVGNIVGKSREIAVTSNYGKSVNTWEIGTNVYSRLPARSYGYMTGTSQATAVKSGKLVREMLHSQ